MRYVHKLTAASVFAVLLGAIAFTSAAGAEIRQVDGHLWKASSSAEKRAYLVGVVNTAAVSHAVQVRRGAASADAPISRMLAAIDIGTIDDAIGRIDGWYGVDATRLDTPVLGVVWLGLVEAAK